MEKTGKALNMGDMEEISGGNTSVDINFDDGKTENFVIFDDNMEAADDYIANNLKGIVSINTSKTNKSATVIFNKNGRCKEATPERIKAYRAGEY